MDDFPGTPREVVESILSAGVLAPSADNHHLLRFSISENRISIRPSDAYRAASSQTRLLAWISYGAVVENMQIQASRFRLGAEVTWFPDEDTACELRLHRFDGVPDSLADAIPLRHTNRRFFTGPPLRASEQADLESQLLAASGIKLIWLDAPDIRPKALRLMRLAESERFRSQSLHAEMFSSLRFDVGFKDNCEQGIPMGAAEIEAPARPFFRLMRHWPTMRLLNAVRTYWFIGWRAAYLPARSSPHLGLVVADGDIRTGAVQTGRGFERLWLRASQMGLALQPMVAAPMYALSQFEGVSDDVREELRSAWAELAPGGTPLMLFRLGHAAEPSVWAGRPPLSHFMQAAQTVASGD